MMRAIWNGIFITFFQNSPESPLIFVFLDKILRSKLTIAEVETHLEYQHNFTREDTRSLFVYCGAFLDNGGNYRNFGNTKFIPGVSPRKMKSVLKELFPEDTEFWMKHCLNPMYDNSKWLRNLGFPPHGLTSYWSQNCNEQDATVVRRYLQEKGIEAYNKRVFKTYDKGKLSYEIRLASQQTSDNPIVEEEKSGVTFRITRGDYSQILQYVVDNLASAVDAATTDHQSEMLKYFVNHFKTGSLEAHVNGSRHWVKDTVPSVEGYIGFIENFRDPAGMHAEFEGFIGVVDKSASKIVRGLADKSEAIIKQLMPWPRAFENDFFPRPEFVALDVVTLIRNGAPSGIDIPKYSSVRQGMGFKNLHLRNVIAAERTVGRIRFVSDRTRQMMLIYRSQASKVHVALRGLFGFGTGKLFQEKAGKRFNFDTNTTNPLTDRPIKTWYLPGDSYNSVFGNLSSSYEQCKAEAVAIYLSLNSKILNIFGITKQEDKEDVMYVNWLQILLSGLRGLVAYSTDAEKWLHPQLQARYVILRVLMLRAPELVQINEFINPQDKQPDLELILNRTQLRSVGRKVIAAFLVKLVVLRATANIKAATEMYDRYSTVDAAASRWRDIVLSRRRPRPILIQCNLRLNSQTNNVELLTYGNSSEDFAQSWVDRWANTELIHRHIRAQYDKDAKFFPLN